MKTAIVLKNQEQIEKIRTLYVDMKLSERDIATQLGISVSKVKSVCKRLQEVWKHELALRYDEYLRREVAHIDAMSRKFMEAWEESKKPRIRKRMVKQAGSDKVSVVMEEDYVVGDAKFLDGVLACSKERSKLLGLYAAPKAPVDKDGNAVGGTQVSQNVLILTVPDDNEEEERLINGDCERNSKGVPR